MKYVTELEVDKYGEKENENDSPCGNYRRLFSCQN